MGLFDLFGKMTPEEAEEHDENWAWSDTTKWTDAHDAEGNKLWGWGKDGDNDSKKWWQ
jgi:hypothetical protein